MLVELLLDVRDYVDNYEFESPEIIKGKGYVSEFDGFKLRGKVFASPVPINGFLEELEFSRLKRFNVSFDSYLAAKVKFNSDEEFSFVNPLLVDQGDYVVNNFQKYLDNLKKNYSANYDLEGFSLDGSNLKGVSLTGCREKIGFESFEKERKLIRDFKRVVLIENYHF